MAIFLRKTKSEIVDPCDHGSFNVEISTITVCLHVILIEHLYFNIYYPNALNMLNACDWYISTCL